MQLLLPEEIFRLLQSRPVGKRVGKLIEYLIPGLPSLIMRMRRVFVYPMLEFINGGNPWQRLDDIFKMLALGPLQFGFIGEENIPMIHGDQFHRHRGQLGHLRGC